MRTFVWRLLVTFAVVLVAGPLSAAPQKPLWKAGQYYGGYPSADKYLENGIMFKISPDKITMKDINMEFPAIFIDENGNESPRSIHFSQANIEPLTLRRRSGTQSLYFAYLDEFGNNWNTELRVTWSRPKQSFKIVINSQSDPIENTFYKASATLTRGTKRGKLPR